jgi:hypothetical protein
MPDNPTPAEVWLWLGLYALCWSASVVVIIAQLRAFVLEEPGSFLQDTVGESGPADKGADVGGVRQ